MDISSIGNVAVHVGVPIEPSSLRPGGEDQHALIRAVVAVNAAGLFGEDNELTLALAPRTRQSVVRIVNRETHELVEQIPSDRVLRLAEELKGE